MHVAIGTAPDDDDLRFDGDKDDSYELVDPVAYMGDGGKSKGKSKDHIKCYNCNQMGRFARNCPELDRRVKGKGQDREPRERRTDTREFNATPQDYLSAPQEYLKLLLACTCGRVCSRVRARARAHAWIHIFFVRTRQWDGSSNSPRLAGEAPYGG